MIRLVRFYQQYKVEDFLNMDVRLFSVLVTGMDQIQAEEQLHSMDAVSYPVMEDKARKKSHKFWYKKAYPENFEERQVKTTDLELF